MNMDPSKERVNVSVWRTKAILRSQSSLCRLAVLFLLCAAPARAQKAGVSAWQGIVRTADGAPVAGVIVRLAGGSKAEAKTGTDGRFKLPPLPVGKYRLSIDADHNKFEYATPVEFTA